MRAGTILIRGGTIYDGTGAPGRRGDLLVRDGRIADMGPSLPAEAERVIDAAGRAVTPGFIDIHTHSDRTLAFHPEADSKLRQGVVCEVIGNCGSSAAPLASEALRHTERTLARAGCALGWRSMEAYLALLEAQGLPLHVIALAGHGTIRAGVLGMEERAPSPSDLRAMEDRLREAMDAGALGVSTGLIYPPSMYARIDEIVALARIAAGRGGMYFSHVRGRGPGEADGVREAFEIGRRSGARVQVAHLHGRLDSAHVIEGARSRGIDVDFDQYPYTASATGLESLLPAWAREGTEETILARLRDPASRARIEAEIRAAGPDWDRLRPTRLKTEALAPLEGETLEAIAGERGIDPAAAVLEILLAEELEAGVIHFDQDEEGVEAVYRLPFGLVGSDGSSMAPGLPLVAARPHPRSYGTFPRVLARYVRERKVLALEEAVAKMTGRTARRLGLRDRGEIARGKAADLVVLDPGTVADRATFDDPHRYPAGIEWVIVEGVIAVAEGEPTGALAGRVLRFPFG